MPQKTRREKERAAQRRAAGQIRTPIAPAPIELPAKESEMGVTIAPPRPTTRRAPSAPMMPQSMSTEFNYSYVFADLRRIALLAVLCFGLMIVLAFVLH